jgi:hypothetical protein
MAITTIYCVHAEARNRIGIVPLRPRISDRKSISLEKLSTRSASQADSPSHRVKARTLAPLFWRMIK